MTDEIQKQLGMLKFAASQYWAARSFLQQEEREGGAHLESFRHLVEDRSERLRGAAMEYVETVLRSA